MSHIIKIYAANSVDLDEVGHYEPHHQDLRCLQIQLFSSMVLRVKGLASQMSLMSYIMLVRSAEEHLSVDYLLQQCVFINHYT